MLERMQSRPKRVRLYLGELDNRDKAATYRILVPVGPGQDRHIVLNLAASLAHQLNGEVIPLQVIPVQDPIAIEAARGTARERNRLFRWSIRLAEKYEIQTYPITRLATTIAEGILDTASEEACDLVLMSWPIKEAEQGVRQGTVVSAVARNVPCDLAVVATHPVPNPDGNGRGTNQRRDSTPLDGEAVYRPQRILVPTAGGPNAPLAIRLALLLTQEYDARVSTIYIAPPNATDEDIQEGEHRITQSIAAMKEQAKGLPGFKEEEPGFESVPIDGQVVKANSIVSGIAESGAAHDLVFIGVTEESFLDQVLFGNIPEQVAQTCPTPVVMVKRYRGLPRLWLMQTWSAINASLPKVNLEEQIEIYRRVHRDARPDVDFFVMMGLATLIATFGLLLNSGAVIIGAMLVAPLFTPLLAFSLSIAQGNVRLLRLSVESMAKGIALAIGLAALLSIFSATSSATPEITLPNPPRFPGSFCRARLRRCRRLCCGPKRCRHRPARCGDRCRARTAAGCRGRRCEQRRSEHHWGRQPVIRHKPDRHRPGRRNHIPPAGFPPRSSRQPRSPIPAKPDDHCRPVPDHHHSRWLVFSSRLQPNHVWSK